MKVFYTSFESTLGSIYIASTPDGICAISISVTEEEFLSEIKILGEAEREDKIFYEIREDLKSYLSGKRLDFRRYRLDLSSGTEFQRRVWNKLTEIPYGETRSYKWLAEEVGSPNGFRAVGGANGKNPVPIIIPCHRVINSDGSLGGYSGGAWIKEALLKSEKALL